MSALNMRLRPNRGSTGTRDGCAAARVGSPSNTNAVKQMDFMAINQWQATFQSGEYMAEPCWTGKDDVARYVPGLPERVPRLRTLRALNEAMSCCTRCPLAPGRTQVVPGVGPKRARVMFLGEAPGATEDRGGEPFVGAAGRLFTRLLEPTGIRREDVYITNVVACRPPQNRAPKRAEIVAHSPWLEEQIRLVQPEVIATLGRVALTYFLPGARITELNGQPEPIEWQGRPVLLLPLFHPAAALRSPARVPLLEAGLRTLAELLA
jgi:uracil-DNA glycosylase